MNEEIIGKVLQDFLDALVEKTLSEKIVWKYAHDLLAPKMDFGATNYAIVTHEYRQVDFHRSYYTFTNAGIVYLVYTMNLSGEDDSKSWDGFELHLQTHLNEVASSMLMQKSEELYRLENAIRSKISDNYRHVPRYESYYMKLLLG